MKSRIGAILLGLTLLAGTAQAQQTISPTVIRLGNNHVIVGGAGGTGTDVALSGDCSLVAGAITCTKTGGTTFGPLATQALPCTAAQGCTGSTTVPSAGQIPVGNAGGTAYAPVTASQDCTVTSTGAFTCLKTNNVSFGTAATVNTGTSGGTLCLLNSSCTDSGTISFTGAGASSTPGVLISGTWFTGGGTTATKPQLLIEPAGTTSTAWNTNGTGFGINAPSGFTGTLFDFKINNVTKVSANSNGVLSAAAGAAISGGNITINDSSSTNTTKIGSGTTSGLVTIGGGSDDVAINSHLQIIGSTPGTPSSCGTGSPSVSGNDTAGTITTGTAATACTMAFASGFSATPKSAVCSSNTTAIGCSVTALSATSITFGLSAALSGTIYYVVFK